MTLWKSLAAATALALCGATIAAAQPARTTAPATFSAQADRLMTAYVETDASFSGAVLVAQDGKVLFRRDYGLANRELNAPNARGVKFRIASLTKQFTATAILQLAEQGKLQLDDPIGKYYPAAPPAWAQVTVRQLLSHRSGIYNYTDGLKTDPVWFEVSRRPEELVALAHDKPLQFQPGAEFRYSNTGYVLLGIVIEKASGEPYADYLKAHIFGPLGMADTGYDNTETVLPGRASGYVRTAAGWAHPKSMSMTVPFAAGGLYSTPEDLLIWDRALYAAKPLSQASMAQMFTDHGGATGFGYGVSKAPNGRLVWSHGGGIAGFSSMIQRMPEDRLTIIVLSNQENAPATPIASDLAGLFYGVEPRMIKASVKLPQATLDRYAGVYVMGSSNVVISRKDSRLIVQAPGRPPLEFVAEAANRFFSRTADASLVFDPAQDAKAAGATLRIGSREVPLRLK